MSAQHPFQRALTQSISEDGNRGANRGLERSISDPSMARWPPAGALIHGPRTQRSTCHPLIGQREQRGQLRRVFGQPSVAHLHVAELALDDSKRVLHLGPDAGFEVF